MFLPLVDWFGDDETVELFSEGSLVEAWLSVERALAATQAELGVIPAAAAALIEAVAVPENIDVADLRARRSSSATRFSPSRADRTEHRCGPLLHCGETREHRTRARPARETASIGSERDQALVYSSRPCGYARATVMAFRTHAHPPSRPFARLVAGGFDSLLVHRERSFAASPVRGCPSLRRSGRGARLGPQSRSTRHGRGPSDWPWCGRWPGTRTRSVAEAALVLAATAGSCGKSPGVYRSLPPISRCANRYHLRARRRRCP